MLMRREDVVVWVSLFLSLLLTVEGVLSADNAGRDSRNVATARSSLISLCERRNVAIVMINV